MAKIFLDPNEIYGGTIGSNSEVIGNTGSEAVTLAPGATGVVIDSQVEKEILAGTTSDYKYLQVGNHLKIYSGTTLVSDTLLSATAPTKMQFANGTVDVVYVAGSETAPPSIKLGGTTVASGTPTSTPADAAPVTPVAIDPTDVGQTYTLTSDKDTVIEGTDVTFTVTRTGDLTAAATLTYNTTGDTNGGTVSAAVPGTDTTPASGNVTFAAGSATATFTVSANADSATEGLEGLKVSLFNGTTVVDTKTVLVNDNPNVQQGQTFTLTTSANNFVGTAGNDTFDAGLVDQATPANSTLTAADVLKGGAGIDTLNITGVGTTLDALNGALVSEIEIINVRATTANTLNAANAAGATTVNANQGAGTFAVTNLAKGAAIGVIGNGTVTNGAVSFEYATATDDVTLNLSGGTKVGTTVTNSNAASAVTKATINSTGAANAIGALELDGDTAANQITSLVVNAATNLTATLTADDYAATAALTVSGAAASVDLGTAANFKSIDASGLTAGGLTIAVDTNTTSFKGGQGNDVVTTAAVAATAAGAVDAGAGTADVLNVANAAHVDTAAEAAVYTNFEVLRNSGATDLDVSLLSGITSVQLNSANAGATKLTAAQAADIKVLASNGTNTIALATATGTADVLGLTLET